ncbi:hypothetical protein, partial [Rhizobium laguerreae]|uniref:hypothetical protein n=1 Tax=Rhizobium laguerreae TaxID=1076926 RepID=UPI0019811677
LRRRKAKSSMRCSSVYGRLLIDISSTDFSTLLAMILVAPQHQLNRLSNLTRSPQRFFSIAPLLIAHTVSLFRLSTANRSSIHAHRTRTSVPVPSPGALFGVEVFRLVAQLPWSCPT